MLNNWTSDEHFDPPSFLFPALNLLHRTFAWSLTNQRKKKRRNNSPLHDCHDSTLSPYLHLEKQTSSSIFIQSQWVFHQILLLDTLNNFITQLNTPTCDHPPPTPTYPPPGTPSLLLGVLMWRLRSLMPPSQLAEHSPHSPQGAKSQSRLGNGPQCRGARPLNRRRQQKHPKNKEMKRVKVKNPTEREFRIRKKKLVSIQEFKKYPSILI